MDEISRQLRAQSRKMTHQIWEVVKRGELDSLEGEEKTIGEALLEHKEYHNAWEFADVVSEEDYEIDGMNPHFHITMHSMVKNQIAHNDPREVNETFQRLCSRGVSAHESEHVIGRVLAAEIYTMLKNKEVFNKKRFLKELKKAEGSVKN